jgi:hypothetical protein
MESRSHLVEVKFTYTWKFTAGKEPKPAAKIEVLNRKWEGS